MGRDTICSLIEEEEDGRRNNKHRKMVEQDKTKTTELHCPSHKRISAVEFASFGNPTGLCGQFLHGNCTCSSTKHVIEKVCLGKTKCKIPIHRKHFQKQQERDDCPHIQKVLALQLKCSSSTL